MKRAAKSAKRARPTPPPYPRVYEMYDDFKFGLENSRQRSPLVGNGSVSIRRYRITVELIDESKEVLAERLRMLWRGTTNGYDQDTLLREAKRLGVELDPFGFGADVNKGERY